jgi:hypothetical protein
MAIRVRRDGLDVFLMGAYAGNFMHKRWLAPAFAAVALSGFAAAVRADDAAALRVFLKDGTSLVSYGEPARVGDRVVFSMPTSAVPNPPLHLVDLSADRVDWDRTNRYGAAARAARYIATQGEIDYAALSNQIVQALSDVTFTTDPARRLAIVERARNVLADWPQNHFNYRQTEVRQMLAMLDEAIADLRAATATDRFTLSLSAQVDPLTIGEPLLPPPSPQEAIEQVLAASRVVDSAAERTSLLTTAVATIDREKASLPVDWVATTRTAAEAALRAEIALDRSYRDMTTLIMGVATRRARAGDVRGLERLIERVHQRDGLLGRRRPDAVGALIAAVEEQLDSARRLQLARDRWALRAPDFQTYHLAIQGPIDLFATLKPALENIKALAGSTPGSLAATERAVSRIMALVAAIVPPAEVVAAHALLVSAAQLAGNAAQIRREAVLAGDMARAWDASSAAAGALMLGARAKSDIQTLLRPPQLR